MKSKVMKLKLPVPPPLRDGLGLRALTISNVFAGRRGFSQRGIVANGLQNKSD